MYIAYVERPLIGLLHLYISGRRRYARADRRCTPSDRKMKIAAMRRLRLNEGVRAKSTRYRLLGLRCRDGARHDLAARGRPSSASVVPMRAVPSETQVMPFR